MKKRLSLIDKRTEFLIRRAYAEGFEKGRECEARELRATAQFMYNSRKDYIENNYAIAPLQQS